MTYITGKPAGTQTSADGEYVLVVNSDGSINTSGGGGGGAVTIADGAAVTIGTTTDASSTSTLVGLLKNLKAALAGTLTDNVAQINGVTPLMGAGNTGTGSLRVTLATDQTALTNPLLTTPTPVASATPTLTNVAGSGSSVTLLALNTNRLGGVIVNDSTSILYVKYGSTASTTSYTYFLSGSVSGVPSTLELPAFPRYTGIITGIWASATGNARCTELTA